MIILPFAIILILAFCITVLLKTKPIESIAAAISSIIIILLVVTLVFSLSFAVYAICALAILLSIASLISLFRRKVFINTVKEFVLNPALLLYIGIVGIYIAMIHDNHIFSFDDFSYWGLSSRAFLVHDGFKVPYEIIGQGQTNAMPIFNSFITFLSGYKEGYLFSGMWIVYWAFLLLPISHLNWARFKTIGIYAFLAYSLLMFTSHYVRPNLYNDIMLGVISGSLVAYYYATKDKSKIKWIMILLGIVVLPHIKYFTGLAFAYFVLIVCYFNKNTLDKFKLNNKNKVKILSFAFAPIISHLLQSFIRPQYIAKHTFTADMHSWCNPGESLAAAISSYMGIVLIMLIALSVVFIVLYKKKNRYKLKNMLLVFCTLLVLVFLGYLYYKLDYGSKKLVEAFNENLTLLKINDLDLYKIIGVLLAIDIMMYYMFIKEKYKQQYKKLSVAFIIMGFLYCIGMMATYSRFSEAEALASASLNRYISSYIVFVLLSALGAMSAKKVFLEKRGLIFAGIAIVYTVIFIMPKPLTLYNFEKNQLKYEQTGLYQNNLAAKHIEANTDQDDVIYLLNQGGNEVTKLYIQYYGASRRIVNEDSLGPAKYEGDVWSKDLTVLEWTEYLISHGYSKMYIMNIDDYFVDTYGLMFEDINDISSGALYAIEYDAKITFKKIG